jgi:hypothetical protein
MPDNPKPIEQALKTYGRRRQEAVGPVSLSPEARRELIEHAGEVHRARKARRAAETAEMDWVARFFALWPRLALAGGLCIAVGVSVMVMWRGINWQERVELAAARTGAPAEVLASAPAGLTNDDYIAKEKSVAPLADKMAGEELLDRKELSELSIAQPAREEANVRVSETRRALTDKRMRNAEVMPESLTALGGRTMGEVEKLENLAIQPAPTVQNQVRQDRGVPYFSEAVPEQKPKAAPTSSPQQELSAVPESVRLRQSDELDRQRGTLMFRHNAYALQPQQTAQQETGAVDSIAATNIPPLQAAPSLGFKLPSMGRPEGEGFRLDMAQGRSFQHIPPPQVLTNTDLLRLRDFNTAITNALGTIAAASGPTNETAQTSPVTDAAGISLARNAPPAEGQFKDRLNVTGAAVPTPVAKAVADQAMARSASAPSVPAAPQSGFGGGGPAAKTRHLLRVESVVEGREARNAAAVMAEFVLEMQGDSIVVTDSDGSTYEGRLQTDLEDAARKKNALRTPGDNAGRSFRVSGQNRTLNKSVEMRGILSNDPAPKGTSSEGLEVWGVLRVDGEEPRTLRAAPTKR